MVLVAQPLCHEDVDELALRRHRGGHEGGGADDVGVQLFGALDEVERVDVAAEVVHLEARGAQHGDGDVLADLVDIASDGAQDDDAQVAPGRGGRQQRRLQHVHGFLHGTCRQHQLGQKDLAGAEAVAHGAHGGGQRVHQPGGVGALLERASGKIGGLGGVALLDRLDEFVNGAHRPTFSSRGREWGEALTAFYGAPRPRAAPLGAECGALDRIGVRTWGRCRLWRSAARTAATTTWLRNGRATRPAARRTTRVRP